MIYVVAILTGWLLAVLRTSAMPYLEVLGVTPDFTLIFASAFAILRRQDEALYVVPICGLLRDLAGSDPTGTSVVGFAPIVVLAAALRLRAMDSQFVPAIAVIAVGTLCHSLVMMAVLTVTGQQVAWIYGITRIMVPLVVVNSLFAAIIYIPVSWFRPPDRSPVLGPGRLTSPL
jgi:rod shape-determining protein MreD